jgi:hypothetical protein
MSLLTKNNRLKLPYKATIRITDTELSTEGVFKEYGNLRIKVSGEVKNGKLNAVIEINDMPIISTSLTRELKECLKKL